MTRLKIDAPAFRATANVCTAKIDANASVLHVRACHLFRHGEKDCMLRCIYGAEKADGTSTTGRHAEKIGCIV